MDRAAVLVIEEGAEATLVCAALALRPELTVLDAPDVAAALARLGPGGVALAIAGGAALSGSPHDLVQALGARGIPVIGVAAGLAPQARQRALAAGVREIYDRPAEWRPYAALIGTLVARFAPPV
jgi:ketopantoate hydroxymethyltransferase